MQKHTHTSSLKKFIPNTIKLQKTLKKTHTQKENLNTHPHANTHCPSKINIKKKTQKNEEKTHMQVEKKNLVQTALNLKMLKKICIWR